MYRGNTEEWTARILGSAVAALLVAVILRAIADNVFPPILARAPALDLLIPVIGGLAAGILTICFTGRPRQCESGHCKKCGYDLRGLSLPRCPECGTPFSTETPSHTNI